MHSVAAVFEPRERSGLEWRSLEQMVADWAGFLSRPDIGGMLRRLYSSAEEYPELLEAYWDRHGRHHWEAVQSTLEQARDQGQLADDAEIDVIQEMLFGTVLYRLVASPQATRRVTDRDLPQRRPAAGRIPDRSAATSLRLDAEQNRAVT